MLWVASLKFPPKKPRAPNNPYSKQTLSTTDKRHICLTCHKCCKLTICICTSYHASLLAPQVMEQQGMECRLAGNDLKWASSRFCFTTVSMGGLDVWLLLVNVQHEFPTWSLAASSEDTKASGYKLCVTSETFSSRYATMKHTVPCSFIPFPAAMMESFLPLLHRCCVQDSLSLSQTTRCVCTQVAPSVTASHAGFK